MNYKQLSRIADSVKIRDDNNPSSKYKDPRFGDDNKDYRKLLSAIKSAARKCGGWLESWNYDAGWTAYFPDEASADKYAKLCASYGFPAFGKRRTGESEIEVILEGSWGPDSYVNQFPSGTYTLYNGKKSYESNLPEQSVVRDLMLQDLKKKLDSGRVLRFVGADHPGLDVIYCSKDKLEEAFQDFKDDYDLAGETIDELCEEVGVDPSHKYFKITFDLKGFSDWLSSTSGDTVEDLDPEMDACIEILETALKEGKITKDQIEFCDDNAEFPFEDLNIY